MILITPRFLSLIAGKYTSAMVLWPFILVQNHEVKSCKVTMHHERIHVKQQLELLVIPFYILYVFFYFINRFKGMESYTAYREIPFEREAYMEESNLDYIKNRKLWAWVKY
jgi:hypothetical protein